MLLMLSIDGAQLYQNKASDCWIYIWVVLDHSPDIRYKKKYVLPGGLFLVLTNLKMWIPTFILAYITLPPFNEIGYVYGMHSPKGVQSRPIFAFGTADGPGMTYLNGLVGHMGAYCCRLYCPVKGRRVTGEKHYYPALLKPAGDYNVLGCNHNDYDIHALPTTSTTEYWNNLAYVELSPNDTQYKERRRNTGISKPSIFSGLSATGRLPLPGCFVADLMHLISLNLTDLLLSLWRGTLDCNAPDDKATWDWAVLRGDVWRAHGKTVANATPYLPGSFDRPPRNPAEKISSGYKAWEYLLYVFALGPGIFYGVLPDKYWHHFCLLVMAVRILHQRRISRDQLQRAHALISVPRAYGFAAHISY
ncbi:hypothetical protein BD779DRAFT_1667695 [Infundibulicybe gibba]|nr:hypothetical protein BD779DRAFT_1667695 [Infundibulicybe gibba]